MALKSERILHLVEHLLPGGTERMAVNICNTLSRSDFDVVLCPTRAEGELKKFLMPSAKCICLKKKHTFDVFAFLRLLKVIRDFNISLVHAHSSTIYWAVACKLIYPKRIKILWHDHNGNSQTLKDTDRRIIQISSLLISGIISVNEILRQWSLRNTSVKKENIIYLRNFPMMPLEYRKSSTDISEFKIVCLANFRIQKDHLTLLRAIKILVYERGYSIIRLKLAGLNLKDDYFDLVMKYIDENSLGENVEVLGSVSNTSELLVNSDLGVLSSVSEGLPVSLLEYGLAGLPVVATDVGQCSDVLGNGKFGILVPPSNPILLADGIEKIIREKNYSSKIARDFKEHISQEYGAEKFMKGYLELINSL